MNKIFIVFTAMMCVSAMASDITPELRAVTHEELYKPHLGVAAGWSQPEGSYQSSGVYSIEYGIQPYIPFSYTIKGLFAEYIDGDTSFNRTSLILEGKYNFGGTIPLIKYSYVGLGLGPAWEDGSVDDGLALAFYPQVGFDWPLKKWLGEPISLGMNANYLISSRSTADTFNLTGVVKYWY